LYWLSGLCRYYKYASGYNTVYNIIKHCVDNKLTVTEARDYIQLNYISNS